MKNNKNHKINKIHKNICIFAASNYFIFRIIIWT